MKSKQKPNVRRCRNVVLKRVEMCAWGEAKSSEPSELNWWDWLIDWTELSSTELASCITRERLFLVHRLMDAKCGPSKFARKP